MLRHLLFMNIIIYLLIAELHLQCLFILDVFTPPKNLFLSLVKETEIGL
jgi:hypothetical protein